MEMGVADSYWCLQTYKWIICFLSLNLGSPSFSSVQFSCWVMPDYLWPHGLQHSQVSLSFTISQNLLKLMPIELVMLSKHFVLYSLLLLLSSTFPFIRVFSSESVLCIRWPNYWSFSFNISPSNEYTGLISCRIDCLISLLSKGLSRVFSNHTVQKHPAN